MIFVFFFIFSLKLCEILGQGGRPIVTIPDGKLRGLLKLTAGSNSSCYIFRGIPFAKIPVGNLRFSNPVRNDPWPRRILDASRDKDSCTQSVFSEPLGQADSIQGSEDCLYINVYSPDINGSFPVMVWIYGGGFVSGSSSYDTYAPDYIIEKNVVYVSFNYRLGVFGFLSTEDSASFGNWGLKDQVLALKWVKNNIQYFGGDPDSITIFGQSAGAASVSYLVQSNLTAGLYHRAIMQSGTSLCLWALTHNARNIAFRVGVHLGIFTLSSQTLIDKLRNIDYQALSMAERDVTLEAFMTDNILAGLPFGVVKEQDNPDAVFSSKSYVLLKNGKFQKIDTMIGYTSNEGITLQPYARLIEQPRYDLVRSMLAPNDLTQNFVKKLLAGNIIRNHYFGSGLIGSDDAEVINFFSIDQFNRPVRETVLLASEYTNVYYYKFSYKGLLGNPTSNYSGVGHGDELNYMFANRGQATNDDELTRNKFITLWTNFAKTGNPTPPETDDTTLVNVIWVPNKPGDNTNVTIKYLNINNNLIMENNPEQADWEFYKEIYRRFGDPPYSTY